MSTDAPHPAACPYCRGTVVNLAQPDYLVRCAELHPNGTVVFGDPVDGADFPGPCLLVCHTCGSTYVAPANVEQVFDGELEVEYSGITPRSGDPGYIGMGVAWTPVPTAPTFTTPHPVTARG